MKEVKPTIAWAIIDDKSRQPVLYCSEVPIYWYRRIAQKDLDENWKWRKGVSVVKVEIREVQSK